MIQTNFINFLKHVVLPKRAWQGHNTSVVRVDLLVILIFVTARLYYDVRGRSHITYPPPPPPRYHT